MSHRVSESHILKRSEQAKRDIDKLKNELQSLIEAGKKKQPINAERPETSHGNSRQQRNINKKTDLYPCAAISKISPTKSHPIAVKSSKEKSKPYNVDEAREYMKDQKKKRYNSLKNELKFSEQTVVGRKQKLLDLQTKTRQIFNKNIQRSRSRSKSKEKNSNVDLSPGKVNSQHLSRKASICEVFRVNPDVISNLPSTSANQGKALSEESLFKNVTLRKSPRSVASESSAPLIIVCEGSDINRAATKIQAAFKGYKQRKCYKQVLLEHKLNTNMHLPLETPALDLMEVKRPVPKWLETKLSPAPYNVARTYKRKLFFAANASDFVHESKVDIATQSSEDLIENGSPSREEIKKILKDSVKNSNHKDLKSFLSHKCLDLDLKKVEELNLISKEKLKSRESVLGDSDSDTSKNIPDLITENTSSVSVGNVEESNEYSLDINSKRLRELKLLSKNISLRSNQQLNKTETNNPKRHVVNVSAKENNATEANYKYSSSNTSRKDSSYIPTTVQSVNRSIELDSSREITLNSSRHLFNPKRMKEMLLLTAFDDQLDESKNEISETGHKQHEESMQITDNALSIFKNSTLAGTRISSKSENYFTENRTVNDKSKNETLSNSELELEICSNVSKKSSKNGPLTNNRTNLQHSKKRVPKKIVSSEFAVKSPRKHTFSNSESPVQSASTDLSLNSTFESEIPTKRSNILSSTTKNSEAFEIKKTQDAKSEKVLPLKSGEVVTASVNSNEINVKFHAEIHLLNDFNQSMCNLRGIENCLNNLHTQSQNPRTIYQNQNTQTSFISSNESARQIISNSPVKGSADIQTDRSMNVLNSSAISSGEFSLLNESVFEKFDKISKSMKDENVLNDTQVSKIGDTSIVDGDNSASFSDNQRPAVISQETLSLQYFEQLIKDEDARREYLKTIFEMRKDVLLDRAKVELSMLEIQKKHLVETDQLKEASAIRKKQRGILIKLQHEKYEMQRLMQMQKAASKERKNLLKEQQNVVKAQLTLNNTTTVSKIKKNHMDRRSSGPLKVFAPVATQHHRLSTSQRHSDISVSSQRSSSVAEELIVTTSYRSDGGSSVTSVTQETSRKTTTVTTEQRDEHAADRNDTKSVIITEINDGNESSSVADDTIVSVQDGVSDKSSERSITRRSKSLECVNRISDEFLGRNCGRKSVSNVDMGGEDGQMDYFSMERLDGMSLVERQTENNKRLLLMREDALQKRRKAAEELLEWHQRLLEEEKKVAELEMAATSVLAHLPLQKKSVFIAPSEITAHQPQMNILWSNKMTGKDSNESDPENVIPSAGSDLNSVKSKEEQVISTKSDNLNSDIQSDCGVDNDKSSSIQSEEDKASSKHSSESYSCEFEHGETTDNVAEDEVSLTTVKSSEHDEDVNILKSQSTLNDIMYNISVISEELSEIYRISSGNGNLNIAENGHLVESQLDPQFVDLDSFIENVVDNNNEEVLSVKSDIIESVIESNKEEFLSHSERNSVSESILIPGSFNSEEADILEQNIKLIEKEIEELQSNTLNNTPEISDENTSLNKSNYIELSEQQGVNSENTITENDITLTKPSKNVEEIRSIEQSEVFANETSEIAGEISQSKAEILDNENDTPEEKEALTPTEIIPEELNISNEYTTHTTQPSESEESIPEKSEVLTSKAPDIIESLSRNTEENVDSHSSSKMPEILENLNEEHDEFSDDYEGIAVVNDDIVNTVRMCTENLAKKALLLNSKETDQEESNESTFDDFSGADDTYSIDKSVENRLDATYVIKSNATEDETALEAIPQLLNLTLLNNSNKENEAPYYKEDERLPSIFGGTEARQSPRNNTEDSSTNSANSNSNSNHISSLNENSVISQSRSIKTDGVLNVKKRVSEILADAKQKAEKCTRIQDLYTTTYDVNYTEKASEIVSELDQLDPEHISPELVEVKAEELELLKKQWAIEQEIKQLEEQQLSEKREQLPYQYLREIPNKPPPPYTPPINQAPVVTTPSVIPANVTHVTAALPVISHYLYTCHMNKTLQSAELPDERLSEFNTPEINELLFDICKELTEEHYGQFTMTDDDSVPSWLRPEATIATLKRPFDETDLCKHLVEQCVDMYGLTERVSMKESSVMRWSRKKRDHVDEVLVRELQVDESNWINYELDERLVADKLVEDLTELMLKEVLAELGDWWTARKT